MPETVLLALKEKPQILESKWVKLWTYNGKFNHTKRVCELDVKINNKLEKIVCNNTRGKSTHCWVKACQAFGLTKRLNSLKGQETKTIEEKFEAVFYVTRSLSAV